MSAERRILVAHTDREQLERLLQVLPEEEVRHLVEVLSGGQITEHQVQMLEQFDERIRSSSVFVFENPNTQKLCVAFMAAFNAFDEFIVNHFEPDPRGGKTFTLFPASQPDNAEKSRIRRSRHEELMSLARRLQESYDALLVAAMNSSERELLTRSLRGATITFDETLQAIVIDGKPYSLPNAQNEVSLARVMLDRAVGEPVEWSDIHKETTGNESSDDSGIARVQKKAVNDTVRRLNQRIKNLVSTDDDLLTWDNKSAIRNF